VVVINGKSSQDLQDEANHIIGRMTSWYIRMILICIL